MKQAEAKATMTCTECNLDCLRFGKHRNGLQRFRCPGCKKTYTEQHERPLGEMTVPMDKATLAIKLLLEGTSVRAAERITELHRDTILKLLVLAGEKCEKIMAKHVRGLEVQDVECDEIWGYIGMKQKHLPKDVDMLPYAQDFGDQYCFVAIERNTKLIINFTLGRRNQLTTDAFVEGLRDALSPRSRFQITTDGFSPYLTAITTTFGHRVDFAQLIKVYKSAVDGEARYSPSEVLSTEIRVISGSPDPKRICTSIVERQNLTMRMQIRRLTRLTNGFSKKFENHWAAIALHMAYYNFCRIHKSLRVTPAMQSGIADHVWSIAELLAA